jgi:hypothetical protein
MMKKNRFEGFVFLVIVLLSNNLLSQQRKPGGRGFQLINKSKPSVYLSFEGARSGSISSLSSTGQNRLLFRFHNNLPWAVRLEARDAGEASEEISLFYDLVDSEDRPVNSVICHVCSTIMLGKGKSILFSISRDKFSNSSAFRVQFSYSWENDLAVIAGLEPKHFAYFYLDRLPETVRPSN